MDVMRQTSRKWHLTLNLLAVSILLLLAFQFVAGMVVNLWYEIPKSAPRRECSRVFRRESSKSSGGD